MARSGSATRSIGRRRSDSSPSRVASQSLPASTPVSRRMVVPELAQSSTPSGLRRLMPAPCPVERVPIRWEVAHPGAAGAQAGGGREDVRRRRRVADVGPALRQGTEDQGAVADRLVTGNVDVAVDPRCRSDALMGHPARAASVADHGGEESPRRRRPRLSGSRPMRRAARTRPRPPRRARAAPSGARASRVRSRALAAVVSARAPRRAARSRRRRSCAARR